MALGFGTSGLRGLVSELTDRACVLYTRAFVRHLRDCGEAGKAVALGGDLRSSTPRLLRAVAWTLRAEGVEVDWCGFLPTPALAHHGFRRRQAGIMVTGSHIPDDRNGIKFNRPSGEILKPDEVAISRHHQVLEAQAATDELEAAVFRSDGTFAIEVEERPLQGTPNPEAEAAYLQRYRDFFPRGCLTGRRVVLYEHSSVARDLLARLLENLGARVIRVGRTDHFVPVDTEAVENAPQLADWVRQHQADALVTADGDGDRPLLLDERGEILRGDRLGILVAAYLRADAVCVPVNANTALERSGLFRNIHRTRIGSPHVIAAMQAALQTGARRVVGYEANGGFLLGSDLRGELPGSTLTALPTRDAALPLLACLHAATRRALSLSQLVATLPRRFTSSGLVRPFPTEQGRALVEQLRAGGAPELARFLGPGFSPAAMLDFTDGARATLANGEIVHLRPSGNAPEFRVYIEADSPERAAALHGQVHSIVRQFSAPPPD